MTATWLYDMLDGITVTSLDIVCSSEQCKVYEFKDIPHVLISWLCKGSSVRYPVHTAEPCGQSGVVAALFLNLNTRWRSVVSFTH